MRLNRAIFTLLIVALCGATTKPSDVLNYAMSGLIAEYQAMLKDPEKPVRVECDFFKQNPASVAIPQAKVLSILERTGGDARVESYVKWQLLSAIDGKFDDANASRAIEIYRRAPSFMLRPGVTEADRTELDKLAAGKTKDVLDAVDQKLIDRLGPFNAYNSPILRYRNDLYARLPVRYESLLAGFDDASQRLANGIDDIDVKPFVASLIGDTRAWMATKPDMKEVGVISKITGKLAVAKGPLHYTGANWNDRQRRFFWISAQRDLNFNGALQQLANELKEQTP